MGPQLKVVERTRTATMLCAASGNPDPEIYWFKDFLPVDIDSSSGRVKQLRSGEALSDILRQVTVAGNLGKGTVKNMDMTTFNLRFRQTTDIDVKHNRRKYEVWEVSALFFQVV